jgi:hypothetical protein
VQGYRTIMDQYRRYYETTQFAPVFPSLSNWLAWLGAAKWNMCLPILEVDIKVTVLEDLIEHLLVVFPSSSQQPLI